MCRNRFTQLVVVSVIFSTVWFSTPTSMSAMNSSGYVENTPTIGQRSTMNTVASTMPRAQNPNVTRVIYLGKDGQIYIAPLDSKNVSTPLLPSGGEVRDFKVTPDGQYVVYQTTFNPSVSLYSVQVTGGTPVTLTQSATAYGMWEISPDSKFVMYQQNPQLFVVPTQGGLPIPLVANGVQAWMNFISLPTFTSDSSAVVYIGANARQILQLYAAPVTGATPIVLNGRMVSGGGVKGFLVAPDGKTVVYWADQDVQGAIQLFAVSVTGGKPTQLTSGVQCNSQTLLFSPDSTHVLCILGPGIGPLTSIPVTGGAATVFAEPNVAAFQITHNGKTVIIDNVDTGGQTIVYSIPIGGGNSTKLAGAGAITPDDNYVVYSPGINAFSLPITGGTSVPLMPGLPERYYIPGFLISPDSKHVIMLTSSPSRVHDIYSQSVAGGAAPIKLNTAPSSPYFKDFQIQITADSKFVLYTSDQDAAGYSDLFVVPITGGDAIRLDSDESSGVVKYRLFPAGTNNMVIDQMIDLP